MSSPRRPRLRRSRSELSAIACSSLITNFGMISWPSKMWVSTTSAMRPSIITLVSSMQGRTPFTSLANST